MKATPSSLCAVTIILGNSNKRFSGVTSTMLQVLNVQKHTDAMAVLGASHLPSDIPVVSFFQLVKLCRTNAEDGYPRLFHARRNDEMIQALILKYIFGAKLKIVFTSTAQRKKTWLTRWLMSKMDGLITTCMAAQNYMPTPADVIIPHGIDPEAYRPLSPSDNSHFEPPFDKYIAIFGRVRHQKGTDLIVQAAINLLPRHPDWGLVIVGETTPDQQAFKASLTNDIQVAGLVDRVLFTGKLPFRDIPKYFRHASIVGALSRNEGFGLTVLEAMSSMVPVVATKAGAWPDVIDDGEDGFLCEIDDFACIEAKLERLMLDSSLRFKMGGLAREKVLSHYTTQREASELSAYYKKIRHFS